MNKQKNKTNDQIHFQSSEENHFLGSARLKLVKSE